MATIKVLSSSSSGNCYLISCNNEVLIIELGINWQSLLKGLCYDLSNVCGCLVSHKHSDHLRNNTLKKAITNGLDVFSCQEVCDIHSDITPIKIGTKMRIGSNFIVQPVALQHDCECYGYLIICNDGVRIFFATDTQSIPYRFKNVHCYLVEANSSDDIIIDNAMNNQFTHSAYKNHLSIDKTIEFLEQSFDSSLQQIILIHLSVTNSNENEFIMKVRNKLGFQKVACANNGDIYDIAINEF